MTDRDNDIYICEIFVTRNRHDTLEGEWLPAEDSDWGTREQAIDTAAEWEDAGYIARIKGHTT